MPLSQLALQSLKGQKKPEKTTTKKPVNLLLLQVKHLTGTGRERCVQALQYPGGLEGSVVAFTSRSPIRSVQSSKHLNLEEPDGCAAPSQLS